MLTVTGVTVRFLCGTITLTWGISVFCVAVPNLIHKSGCFRLGGHKGCWCLPDSVWVTGHIYAGGISGGLGQISTGKPLVGQA